MIETIDHAEIGCSVWTPQEPEDRASVREELERIISSPLFANSKRYPNLLRYVVEASLHGRADALKERTLGMEVFSREPDYDTNLDHVVRNTASEVRKRLMLYYRESSDSRIRIELPVGAYAPVFRRFEPITQVEKAEGETGVSVPLRTSRLLAPRAAVLAAIMVLIAGIGIGYAIANLRQDVHASPSLAPQTMLQLLSPRPGQHLDVVVGDPTLALGLKRHTYVGLDDYRNRRYLEPSNSGAELNLDSKSIAWFAQHGIDDLDVFPLVDRVFESMPPGQVSLKHPTELNDQDFQTDNALMIGGPRVDPWVQLFENSVNFRTELIPDTAAIRNVAPRVGEQAIYKGDPANDIGYARIAYIPNIANRGKVMLLSGPCLACTEAAANFAMDPANLPNVMRLFGANHLSDMPSFELLLEVHTKASTPVQSKLIAWRKGPKIPD